MKYKIFYILFLFIYLSFSQSDKENYEIYSSAISEVTKFGIEKKTDTIILIEKFIPEYSIDFEVVENCLNDSIPNWAIDYLYFQSEKNEKFIVKIKNDKGLKHVLKKFTTNFKNHPKINSKSFETERLKVRSISSKEFDTFFKEKKDKINKGWKKIKETYKTNLVISFSRIEYDSNYAILYYQMNCGGLCGNENLVVFEKINEKWEVLSKIKLSNS